MAREDLRGDLKALRDQVEALREALADVAKPYSELVRYVEELQGITRSYFRLVDLYARHGSISPDLVIPELKDDISRHIVAVLFDKGDRNISQITDAVKGKRGTASRRIVRERLKELEARGILVASPGPRGSTYRISDATAEKWAKIVLPVTQAPVRPPSKEGDEPPKA